MKRQYKLKAAVRPPGVTYWYEGSMHLANMPPKARTAYRSWVDQRARCNNPRSKSYKYYGAVGVRVKYSAREFVGWWLEQLKKFNGIKPTVSRIDHAGHYTFGNVKLESHMDNCVNDVFRRHGPPGLKTTRKVDILQYPSMDLVWVSGSMSEAAILTGVAASNIWKICSNPKNHKRGKGFSFRYSSVDNKA